MAIGRLLFNYCAIMVAAAGCSRLETGITRIEVTGNAMSPTIEAGDVLVVNTHLSSIAANDLVYYKIHAGSSTLDLVSRVVAVPGQTVELDDDGRLLVDGIAVKQFHPTESYALDTADYEIGPDGKRQTAAISTGPVVVPADHFFVLGDNPAYSLDSRYWGALPSSNIVGKVVNHP